MGAKEKKNYKKSGYRMKRIGCNETGKHPLEAGDYCERCAFNSTPGYCSQCRNDRNLKEVFEN